MGTSLQKNLEKLAGLSWQQKVSIANNYFPYFMEEFGVLETGEKFSFKGYEYLMKPYSDEHPFQVHKKCTQVGITTKALFSALHGCINKYPKGIIYFFPTDRDVTDFSRGRVSPIIEHNKIIGQYIADTDTVGMKRVNKSFIYFRGMKSKSQLKSVPADKIIIDELDEVEDQTAPEMAAKRLSASDFQHREYLSNPTIPDYGIDKMFQLSDQKHYMLKCPHCGEWNCLEDTFPDCLIPIDKDTVILGCKKCKKQLDKAQGEWVAKFPSVKDCSGYQYSQLFAPKITAKQIYDEYMKALKEGKLANFMNLTLGQAYISAQNRLTIEHVLSLVDNEFPSDFWAIPAPCYMGVDQGKDLHIVFKKRLKDRIAVLPALEFDFNALDKYMAQVSVCVIDGLPETRNARAFADRNLGKVYLNYYNEHQKGSYRWDDAEYTVQENRTESMDSSHDQISNGTIILPPYCSDLVKEYAEHCHNTAKKLHEDDETGSRRYIWVKLGADHYRHADNYATIAMSGANNMPTGSYY